jgi:hypothetical protein
VRISKLRDAMSEQSEEVTNEQKLFIKQKKFKKMELSTECLIANVLFYGYDKVNYQTLKNIRNQIKQDIKPENFKVSLSRDSLYSAVWNNPRLFKKEGKDILKADNSSQYYQSEYLESIINGGVPSKTLSTLKSVLNYLNDN